jgi:undecaprenyl-diphosphatase
MTTFKAILLGIIQGIAEFLPISSSGHLVLVQNWLNIHPVPFLFDVVVHFSTTLAVIYFFRQQIKNLSKQMLLKLMVGSIPIFIIGFFLESKISDLFALGIVAAGGLLITSLFNFITAHYLNQNNKKDKLSLVDALTIGIWQTLALIPGVSRSGSTLMGSALTNQTKETAFEFSFLLSIPAILAANLYQLFKLTQTNIDQPNWSYILIGGVSSFVISLLSLKLLKQLIQSQKKRYHLFGWYCLILGIVSILLNFI